MYTGRTLNQRHVIYREGYSREKKRPKVWLTYTKWKLPDLEAAIRAHLNHQAASQEHPVYRFSVEDLADHFRARKADISRCMHKLRVSGMRFEVINKVPHDIYRNSTSCSSGWRATFYDYRDPARAAK